MIKTSIICDVCGKEKNNEKNWIKVFPEVKEFTLNFTIKTENYRNDSLPLLDICGENCLIKWFSQFVSILRDREEET